MRFVGRNGSFTCQTLPLRLLEEGGVLIDLPPWPNDAETALSVTVDFDACEAPEPHSIHPDRAWLSSGRYGAVAGVPRLLDIFSEHELRATFYVPGWVADTYASVVSDIVSAGHDLGLHGYRHLPPTQLPADEQLDELRRGIDALTRASGVCPGGYRAPAWAITDETLTGLSTVALEWDSSCMGADDPYFEFVGDARVLEFPVHWGLDDWAYVAFSATNPRNLGHPATLVDVLQREHDRAARERGHLTLTVHPECSGRRHRAEYLSEALYACAAHHPTWFGTHRELHGLLTPSGPTR